MREMIFILVWVLLLVCGCEEFNSGFRYGILDVQLLREQLPASDLKTMLLKEEVPSALALVDEVAKRYGLHRTTTNQVDSAKENLENLVGPNAAISNTVRFPLSSYGVVLQGPPHLRSIACAVYLYRESGVLEIVQVDRYSGWRSIERADRFWEELRNEFIKRYGKDRVKS